MAQESNYNLGTPNNNPPQFDDSENSSFDIMEWINLLISKWYLFVISVVVMLGIAYLLNRKWQPQYVTQAKIISTKENTSTGYNFTEGFANDLGNVNSQLQVLSSFDLIRKTVSKIPSFKIDYYTRGKFKTNYLFGYQPIDVQTETLAPDAYNHEFKFIPVGKDSYVIELNDKEGKDTYPDFKIQAAYGDSVKCQFFTGVVKQIYTPYPLYFGFRDVTSLETEFSSRLQVGYIEKATSVMQISLAGTVTSRDKVFLNALADEYIASDVENKNREAVRIIDFINSQLATLSDSLETSESRLRHYRQSNNLIDVNSYSSDIYSQMTSLEQQQLNLDLQDAYLKNISDYINKNINADDILAPSTLGISDQTLFNLISQYNDLVVQQSNLGEKNPLYASASTKIDNLRKTILQVLDNVRSVYNINKSSIDKQYTDVMGNLKTLPEKELAFSNFERNYKINDSYYTFLLQKQFEAQIRKASNVSDYKVLQAARVISIINGGDVKKKYLTFLLIGLLIPALYVIISQLLIFDINTENDIAKLCKFTVIGNINHSNSHSRIPVLKHPKSVYAEGLRVVRNRLDFITKRKVPSVFMLTSADSGDGKTHLSLNLASVYSLISKKVLLVDMDLRNPNLTKTVFKGDSERKGLTHFLVGSAELKDIIIRPDDFPFDFLPAGVIPPNPAELIYSNEMKKMLDELKTMYDYIVIDTSPIGLVADVYGIVHQTDVNILVARAGKTNKKMFGMVSRQIVNDEMPNVYVVLNDIVPEKNRYGYTYGYYGKYGKKGKNYHSYTYYTDEN